VILVPLLPMFIDVFGPSAIRVLLPNIPRLLLIPCLALLACDNNISETAGGGVCGRVGALNSIDFTGLAVAGWTLRGCGRCVSRIASARGRCVLAVEWAAHAKAAAVEDMGE
jgi:hypothetical protein